MHIADVSHFVQQGTDLDHWASTRATSVYLVHKVKFLFVDAILYISVSIHTSNQISFFTVVSLKFTKFMNRCDQLFE